MNINIRDKAHQIINHVFQELLPAHGMPERPGQISLAHQMLDAMIDDKIGLYDAGTGSGKTFAYLVACTALNSYRTASGMPSQPVLLSTSSIALQNAIRNEYLPFLSGILLQNRLIDRPLNAVIRKGKTHYVCDKRLKKRLRELKSAKKNPKALKALRRLADTLDMDTVPHLSNYDKERVCVPTMCDCHGQDCRYKNFLRSCKSGTYRFQICNHNLLMADLIRRAHRKPAILPDSAAIIVDEAHKLAETARQMLGITLTAEEFKALIRSLRAEHFFLAAEYLSNTAMPLIEQMSIYKEETDMGEYVSLLAAPYKALQVIHRQLQGMLEPGSKHLLEKVLVSAAAFFTAQQEILMYVAQQDNGSAKLCATICDVPAQLRRMLWAQPQPIILTSGTMAVGNRFKRFKEETGLGGNLRVREAVFPSPFPFQENCLLYLPRYPPLWSKENTRSYYDALADEIEHLMNATYGHALVLFTSYVSMSAVQERLLARQLNYMVFVMGRNTFHTISRFRQHPGSVLLAAGAAWEGMDFPGDGVSLLVIPRLPFPYPNAVKENERERYSSLQEFIRSVALPEMQIKLRQGFGRAIRTETDTCVIAILDERAAHGGRYYNAMRNALPDMKITSSLRTVERFIREKKPKAYFEEGMI
ncbi:MAG: ATP-dependent DNA helicase [Clostridiaceae bacterium]|nr:ATP-dependent DNA helicase [Clostridiaceae bacterium]